MALLQASSLTRGVKDERRRIFIRVSRVESRLGTTLHCSKAERMSKSCQRRQSCQRVCR